MTFRFVHVNDQGEQVQIDSMESLRTAVEAGEIHEESLLYDGLTGDWAPARVHPIFRLIQDTLQEGEVPVDDGLLLERTLVLEEVEVDPEALFWEEQARRAEEDELEGRFEPAFPASDVMKVRDTGAEIPAPAAAEEPRSPGVDPPPGAPAGPPVPSPNVELLLPLDVPGWDDDRPLRENVGVALRMEVPRRQATLMMVLAGVAGWAIADSWASPVHDSDGPEVVHVASMYRVSRHFTRGHADVRTAAFTDMVRGMDALRAQLEVDAPPDVWLTEGYLSSPSDHPEVAVYWGRYAAFVAELREREEQLFRSGYVSRLQRKGITGTVLTIQVARALTEFGDDEPRREVLYGAMDELATAALSLHGALLQDESERAAGRLVAAPSSTRALELERVVEAMVRVSGGDTLKGEWLGDAALAGIERLELTESTSEEL